MDTTISPNRPPRIGRTPAVSAGPPGTTFITMMPLSCSSSAITSGAKTMPRKGRRTKPLAIMLSTFFETRSIGMARPTPAKVPLPLRMAVFTPMTLPSLFNKGPPLLPGLIEASVWMTPLIGRPPAPSIVRDTPLTMPRLRLCSRPNGLPKAKTSWPTTTSPEVPLGRGLMSPAGAASPSRVRAPTRRTATSEAASEPTTTASSVVRRSLWPSLLRKMTYGFSMPLMTWKFVTTWFLSQTKPLP
mmetsp:Transcript_92971/g.258978  ORF Transcript_92971/g.258978 Transcript_92971/m.258978 type:complete len:244 (-) Transcript_92971:701-1432(-)